MPRIWMRRELLPGWTVVRESWRRVWAVATHVWMTEMSWSCAMTSRWANASECLLAASLWRDEDAPPLCGDEALAEDCGDEEVLACCGDDAALPEDHHGARMLCGKKECGDDAALGTRGRFCGDEALAFCGEECELPFCGDDAALPEDHHGEKRLCGKKFAMHRRAPGRLS